MHRSLQTIQNNIEMLEVGLGKKAAPNSATIPNIRPPFRRQNTPDSGRDLGLLPESAGASELAEV